MKNFLLCILVLALSLFFVSCNVIKPYDATDDNVEKITINEPTEDSLDDYVKTADDHIETNNTSSAKNEFDGVYFANTNSKKFHKSTCGSAKTIKDTNLYKTTMREELINEGYVPCLRCNP